MPLTPEQRERRDFVDAQMGKMVERLFPHRKKRKLQWWLWSSADLKEAFRVVLVEQLQACTSEEFYPEGE